MKAVLVWGCLGCLVVGMAVFFIGQFVEKTEKLLQSLGRKREKLYGFTIGMVGAGVFLLGVGLIFLLAKLGNDPVPGPH